jgi:GntR family transcriptional regulator
VAADSKSDRPVFKQIADDLRAQIQSGKLGEGEQLPSETELMAAHGAARGTVRQAIMVLKGEGLVLTEHGRGAFVRLRPPLHRLAYDRFSRRNRAAGKGPFLADAKASGYSTGVDSLSVRREKASAEVARRLGLRAGTSVVVRQRRYLTDDQPVELATSYIPGSIARGTAIENADTGPGGIYARIEEKGYTLDHFEEEIMGRMPTPEESRALDMSGGVPVLEFVRLAQATDGTIVELCQTVMAADRFVLAYRLPAK